MKVLFITPRVPWPLDHGGRIRTFELLRELATHHEVHLICGRTEDDADPADLALEGLSITEISAPRATAPRTLGAKVRKIVRAALGRSYLLPRIAAPGLAAATARANAGVDVIVLDNLWTATTLPALEDAPVLFSSQNVESDAVRQALGEGAGVNGWLTRREIRALERLERRMVTRAASTIAVSPEDAARFVDLVPGCSPIVIANGARVSETPLLPAQSFDPPRLLYVGGYDYPPNAEAARTLALEVLPIVRRSAPAAEVTLVGADPLGVLWDLRNTPGVHVAGRLVDLVPVYRDASALVVPLRFGGGSRLKIVEAWAFGRPVIATAAGASGLSGIQEHHWLLGTSASELASAVLRLASDPSLVKRLVTSGRQLAEEAYDWSVLARRFREAVEDLPQRKSGVEES